MDASIRLLESQEGAALRAMFAGVEETVAGVPWAYLDNAATTLKPHKVIDAIADFYRSYHGNVHRTTHKLAYATEELLEGVREEVRQWIHAADLREIVFTSGATGALNLIAQSYGRHELEAGDEVILSVLEHHSNFLPWKRLCEEKECALKIIPINKAGSVDVETFARLLSARTRLVALTHVSHVTGKVLPIRDIVEAAHGQGAIVVLDATQAAPHMRLDVGKLGVDFLTFSAHKMYGPTGVGVLYGKRKLLEEMPPYEVGGGMIHGRGAQGELHYAELPHRLEAGTPPLASIVGLGSSIQFLKEVEELWQRGHDYALCGLAAEGLGDLGSSVTCLGAGQRAGILSFHVAGRHALDVAMELNVQGIAVRGGLQCATPLMEALDLPGVVRASFAMYNTAAEVERLVRAIAAMKETNRSD